MAQMTPTIGLLYLCEQVMWIYMGKFGEKKEKVCMASFFISLICLKFMVFDLQELDVLFLLL